MPKHNDDYGEKEFERLHPHGHDAEDDLSQMLAEDAIARMMGTDDGDFSDNDHLSVAETGGPYVVRYMPEDAVIYDPEAYPDEIEKELVSAAIDRSRSESNK